MESFSGELLYLLLFGFVFCLFACLLGLLVHSFALPHMERLALL